TCDQTCGPPACECRPGFVRTAGTCVRPETCPEALSTSIDRPCAAVFCAGGQCVEYDNTFGCFDTACGPHEEFKICATCEKTCGPVMKKCDEKCHPPTCQCVEGYVRHNGRCVKSEKCDSSEHAERPKRYFQRL
ncbi:TIL domain-containing protein, partial [Trichostrongylus colubriformis]